jgi:hypothetical protein
LHIVQLEKIPVEEDEAVPQEKFSLDKYLHYLAGPDDVILLEYLRRGSFHKMITNVKRRENKHIDGWLDRILWSIFDCRKSSHPSNKSY